MNRLLIRVFILLICASLPFSAQADWVNDWFKNSKIDSSASYKNQQRGFYQAPGFSGRLDTATDYPVTVTKPKLSGGCGGIDLFLGGVSFLDADYLVEKFQRMMQAAPAIAFDMALKTMCKECSETLVKMDAAANWLNGLQMNECAMSKRMVTTVSQGDPNILGAMWDEMSAGTSLSESMNKSWQQAQEKSRENDNEPYIDLNKKVKGCPAQIKSLFQKGSVIAHAAERTGMSEYADIMRGYIGDVIILAEKDDKIPLAQKVQPCPDNQQTNLEDILYGRAKGKREDGTCYLDSKKSVIDIVKEKLSAVSEKIKKEQELSGAEIAFINATPYVPVYSILKKAVIQDNVSAQIDMMTEVVSISYTYYILNDLYRNTNYLFTSVKTALESPGMSAGNKSCDLRVYTQATTQFDSLHEALKHNQASVLEAYMQKLNHLTVAFKYQQMHQLDEKSMKERGALDYGS